MDAQELKEMFKLKVEQTAKKTNCAVILRRMIRENNEFIQNVKDQLGSPVFSQVINALIERVQNDNRKLTQIAENLGVAYLVRQKVKTEPEEIPGDSGYGFDEPQSVPEVQDGIGYNAYYLSEDFRRWWAN